MRRIGWLVPWLSSLAGCFDPEPPSPFGGTSTTSEPTTDVVDGESTVDPSTTLEPDSSSGPPVECLEDAECQGLAGPCVVGVCGQDGTCTTQPEPDATACDDEQWCTENDACLAGACVGQPRTCESTGPCTMGACDEEADACTTVPDPAQVDMACDDGDGCTLDGTCIDGECQGAPNACTALDSECSVGTCDGGACQLTALNEGMACAVGNTCAVSSCQAGACTPVTILNENAACDDGQWCTAYERCIAGTCTPEVQSPCQDDLGCGTWACDDDLDACVATPQNEGVACDDGIACTIGTICLAGECSGGGITMEVFSETFANNLAGWTLGPEWEIGPAQQTPCNQEQLCSALDPTAFPGGDPDLDHTPTDDNGLAGVVIGGIIDQNLHPFHYLESPAFDASVPGTLTLGFYRWLNSDYTPFIENRVEVFNGMSWVTLWASGASPPIADAPWSMASGVAGLGWTYQQFDVTPYKNTQMRVRFGFNVDSEGVYPAPGWNVDDVRVAALGCGPG